jgi:hypothetical protein
MQLLTLQSLSVYSKLNKSDEKYKICRFLHPVLCGAYHMAIDDNCKRQSDGFVTHRQRGFTAPIYEGTKAERDQ